MYIVLDRISKTFGEKKVVDQLSLTLEKGKILCLLGASGCGKTTTLRMIGGFLPCDEGKIIIDGEELTGKTPEERPVSTVFQSYALFPHMSVIENVIYGLKFKGIRGKEAVEKGYEYLEIVGLKEYAKARIHEISGGQQQRVALARALAVRPKVLLLDEPFSNLDAKLRITMRDEMKQLQKELGMTMIFVTHDQEEAMVLADSIAIMNDGKLAQVGNPREIYEHPTDPFVMNFLGLANCIPMADGRRIYVRPEAVKISKDQGILGQVIKGDFLGFYNQYQIQVGDQIAVIRESSDKVYENGQTVRLLVDENKAMLAVSD